MISPQELRQKFRDFFRERNHEEIPSASLIPSSDDPTVLFTTAGMQPLVPNLMGAPHRAGKRLFDTQKSFRANDIDEVGDDTHHTFFEMLGNWSLGDYFKEEAIDLAYDFFVKELQLDPKRFAITIFKGDADAPKDEEAKKLWLAKEGITEAQIFEFDKKDNFWGPAGATGPCGPCSEIHYDRGEKYGANVGPNSDENQRFVEIWNLVFMEYNKTAEGKYEKLEQKNVDTGVGFERLLAVLNEQDSAFDTPLFANILHEIEVMSRKKYTDHKREFRIISDHLRAATFCIADGVTPGNEGRNYVLRSIIRRAIRNGRRLGISEKFVQKVSKVVISEYKTEYPELMENQKTIFQILEIEEENFLKTLGRGEKMLEEILESKTKAIDGKTAFQLFDTYGFPLDLTRDFAKEHGLALDEEGFALEMTAQRERSKNAGGEKFARTGAIQAFAELPATEFVGDTESIFGDFSGEKSGSSFCEAKILGIFEEKDETVIALDKTIFYAESGGQVWDSGKIMGKNGEIEVNDCQKTATKIFLHRGKKIGNLEVGEIVRVEIDADRRRKITAHHSLAHLFLSAAKKILNDPNMHQAGSHVDENRMRLDFTFPRGFRSAEIEAIEELVAQFVFCSAPISIAEKDIETAKKEGAEATFGEKYGSVVRTVKMGEFSYELCGGTHVRNTAEIGAVKILSESGVSAGVRRVEIVSGRAAQELLQEKCKTLGQISEKMKTPEIDVLTRLDGIFSENKTLRNDLGLAQKKLAEFEANEYAKDAKEIGGKRISVMVAFSGDANSAGNLARAIAQKIDLAIIITKDGNVAIVSGNSEISAREILQKITGKFGGGGGGNEKIANGGGIKNVTKEEIEEIL